MDVGFIKMGDNVTDLDHHASHLMVTEKETIKQESEFEAKPDYAYTFEMNEDHGHINFTIAEDGTYAIVTEHVPSESNMQIFDENQVELLPIIEHEVEGHSH
jgi:membrane protease subunit (stomatin/prohibitin family)